MTPGRLGRESCGRLERDYQRIIAEIIPEARPASERTDDQLEPPWEVVARLRAENARVKQLFDKLTKVAEWLDRLADGAERSAKTSERFPSLHDANLADAKNYRATAADIRTVLKPRKA